jgi:hypothetical protein
MKLEPNMEAVTMTPKEPLVPIFNLSPFTDVAVPETVTKNADCIILATFVNGGVPTRVVPFIEQKTKEGIPVFLVADKLDEPYTLHAGNPYGITSLPDQPLFDAVKAGALPIEKVNLSQLSDIQAIIRENFLQGKHNAELGEAVRNHFGYTEGEMRPVHEWKNPNRAAEMDKREQTSI